MAQAGRRCEPEQELAGLEPLRHAHVFTELERGLYTGMNKRSSADGGDAWKTHILGPTDDGPETSQAFFFRLEYQDGKRKAATQAYHGSGRVHCHSLNYLREPKRARLEEKIRATEPSKEEATLRGYVMGRPRREGAASGWPIHEEDSCWDDAAQLLRLKHTAEDAASGHRAYFPETLEIAKCHQDALLGALLGNDRGPLLKYCATYTPKFSDAFQKEWLADEASAFSVARRVLFDYKPCEPEMWLYLAAKTFPPCRYSGTMQQLRALWPGMRADAVPKIVQLYQESSWRREDMSLLEFARKTNKQGEIAQWVRHKRNKQGSVESLESFANSCEMEGEKLIAVETVSVFNDRYFGQWLALRSPFRALEDLIDPEVADKVPEEYQQLGSALARCPEHWSDEEAVAKELELEAMGVAKVKSFLAKLKAERHLVEQHLAGHIVRGDAAGARRSLEEAGFPVTDKGLELNRQQQLLRDSVLGDAERAAKARATQDMDELDALREAAIKNARPIAGLGPPGTGKTTVLNNCVDRVLESGGRVLYALPTARQLARVRGRHPTADVDTCAAAFWLWKERADEHLDALAQYDLVVVDEVSQLDAEQFERILQMWAAADKIPALVFAGDFWQLPGVNNSQATDSPKWRSVFVVNLREMWRCKDQKLRKKLELLRTAAPTREQLADICRGHKAWTHSGGAAPPPGHDGGHLHPAEGSRCEPACNPGALREAAQASLGHAGLGLGGKPRQLRRRRAPQKSHAKAAPARDIRGAACM